MFLAAALFGILIIGIGLIVWHRSVLSSKPTAERVIISRQNPLNQRAYPLMRPVAISDTATVQALRSDIDHLPKLLSGINNCLMDDGVTYTLQFSEGEKAVIDARGCQTVMINDNKTVYTLSKTSDSVTDLKNRIETAIGQPMVPSNGL